ncbi:MAG TPA: DAK2 domain-containing protein [Candidatus Limnocylindrales bacterium]
MGRRSCDGPRLFDGFRAAVANLEAHVDEINALNVYPVPDGDTGSNMAATVQAALAEASAVRMEGADRVAAAISFGALMGARGNSGVITSQIFRGMADGLGGKRHFNALDLAHCLSVGARTAYGAVGKPVEGTILTVIRESAAAAVVAAERDNDLEIVLTAAVEAAAASVARTPSLLPILHEAGVVDAGGQGLYRLLQGALLELVGRAPAGSEHERAEPRISTLVAHADAGYGYETMFLLQPQPGGALDVDAIRGHLQSIGESVLVAGDPRALKVHVHNERPDSVLAYGLSLGTLTRISVENLDGQARDARERRAREFTNGPGAGSGLAASGTPAGAPSPSARTAGSTPDAARPSGGRLPLAVVAVADGDGLAAVFESFGVARVVRGGQSSNPSTGELLAAVDDLEADEILLLPNNPNVVLAARQMAELTRVPVRVVPTRNAAEGFAALLALDPSQDAAANAGPMIEAGRALQSLQVTEAIRDAKIGGRKVKKGQTIVLDPDEGLIAVDGDRSRAVVAALGSLAPGFELITLYYGDGADLAEAEALSKVISAWRSDIEVELVHGGQPHYRYLIAAE